MSFQLTPLSNGIGVACTGLDLDAPIDAATQKALYDAWIEAGILVFPGLGAGPERLIALSRCFGTLDVHPVKALVTETEFPELMVLDSKLQAKLSVYYRESDRAHPFVGFIPWHSDLVFTTTPNHAAILNSRINPAKGGDTAWIDTAAAYAALSPAMKQRIADLEVEYQFCSSLLDARYGRDPELRMQVKGERKFPAFPPVAHPLVWPHPVSGVPALNLSPLHLVRVVGMDDAEGDALLQELVAHVTHQDFSYVHHWEVNDMVLWDNWRTLHSALGYPLGDSRLVHRTTISGNVKMGRVLGEGVAAAA